MGKIEYVSQTSPSCWGTSRDGAEKTDADGYHWVDDEFYLASSSNEKIVIIKSSAKENDYVDYTAFCHKNDGYHAKFNSKDCFDIYTSSSSEDSLREDEIMTTDCRPSSRSQQGNGDVTSSPSNFGKVAYRRQRSGIESSKQYNEVNQKKLIRWTSEGNLSQLQHQSLAGDFRMESSCSKKRLSMPLCSNDLEKAFEGWGVVAPQVKDIETLKAFENCSLSSSSSDEDGDSLASDIGLDHMMCQRLIGPNAVQDRDSPPSKIGLKMNQLILCYTRESSREDSIDLDTQVWDLAEKVDRLSENSRKIWDAAAAVLMLEEEEAEVGVIAGESGYSDDVINDRYDGDDDDDDDDDEEEEEEELNEMNMTMDEKEEKYADDQQDRSCHLKVPQTRDIGIDAMSRSQNSLTNSVEVVGVIDIEGHHPFNHNHYRHRQEHSTLSSASVSRSSSSSSSLSLSVCHIHSSRIHQNKIQIYKEKGNEECTCKQQQLKSSTPDLPKDKDVNESSADYQNIFNTVGNDGSLDRSRLQTEDLTTLSREKAESEETPGSQHGQQNQHVGDDSVVLNTSSNNYMNIDKITSYSDFVADLEMNAICESNNHQHNHHQQQQRHQYPHTHHHHHPVQTSPIRTITNGSLTPTLLDRKSNCQTCPPILNTAKNNTKTNTKIPSAHTNIHSGNPPTSDFNHCHHHTQDHHLHQRPHTTLPYHSTQSSSLPQKQQLPFSQAPMKSNPNYAHAPYVNQTIPRLPQSRIPPFPTNSPIHRPQSYPCPSHSNPPSSDQPCHFRTNPSYPPPPPPLPSSSSSSKSHPNPKTIHLSSLFPPPPPPAPEPTNAATESSTIHTPSLEDITSNQPPPPLPPRLPTHRVSRTQDGRPQVMIRPHRIQKQHSNYSSPSSPQTPSNQRPHSFSNYPLSLHTDKPKLSSGDCAPVAVAAVKRDMIQRPRCLSVNASQGARKSKDQNNDNEIVASNVKGSVTNDNEIVANTVKGSSKNSEDSKTPGSKIPRRKLKTRRELVAMRKKSTDCAVECGNGSVSSPRKSAAADGATCRSWKDIDVSKGTPLSDSSGADNSSS